MGKKYIIELENEPFKQYVDVDEPLYRVKGFNSLVFDEVGLRKLTPYTEPDLEQVRKKAFEEGKKQAKVQAELDVCHDIEKVAKANYQQGLNDAWQATKKIALDFCDMTYVEFYNTFNGKSVEDVLRNFTAAEAIAKIKEYEDSKQEIKVGDEVGYYGVADEHGNVNYSGVVLEIREDDYLVMEKDGKTYALKKNLVMSRTGGHFDEIATILEKMRKE